EWVEHTPQPKKEPMKKYRLVIPDMIEREDINAAYNLNIHNGSIVEFDSGSVLKDGELLYSGGPEEWLHEIEEEKPIQPEKWMKKYTRESSKTLVYDRTDMRNAFRAGEGNNKLRHRETVSCDAYFALTRPTEKISSLKGILFVEGWDACKKSHNLD
ncbi:hypothetical protein KAT92_06610, partial [Candidatus Babeliales bacterium]|nr:hypothetical protein [Candidatus Babeliales bacterium]